MKYGSLCRSLVLLAVFVVAAGGLAGCFFSSTPSTPSALVSQVTGSIVAPAGTVVAAATHRPIFLNWLDPVAYALSSTTPLARAKVIAINFADGKQVGTEATTDDNGKYTISNIPAGIDVLIVATKNTGAGVVRLTSLVADLKAGNSNPADVNAATSVVAEAYAVNKGKTLDLTAAVIQTAVETVTNELANISQLNLTVGGGVISADLGDGLLPTAPTEVKTIVQKATAEPARAMVRDLLAAGVSASGTFESELQAETDEVNKTVAPYLDGVAKAFVAPYGLELTQVAPGEYTETALSSALGSAGPGTWGTNYGTWTITNLGTGITQVVTITTSGNYDTVTFTITGPGGFEESGTQVMHKALISGQLHSDSFSFTLRTATGAAPVSFTGSMSATLDTQSLMTSGTLQGTFSSDKFNANGALTVETFSEDRTVPKMISFTGTVKTISRTYNGTFTLDAVRPTVITIAPAVPSRLVFDGSFSSSTTGVSATGKLTIQITNAATYNPTGGEAADNFVQGTFTFNGSFAKPALQTTAVDLTITRSSYVQYSANLSYTRGTAKLTGTIVHNTNDATNAIVVHLTNEAGLVADMTVNRDGHASGSITGFGATLATFAYNPSLGINQVTYADGGLDSLF